MRIVIYAGYYAETWNADDLNTSGLGGTEQCIVYLASQLAKKHEVFVTGNVENATIDKVEYCDLNIIFNRLGSEYIDCVIGVSYINYLIELKTLNFNKSIFWVHNTDFYPWHRGQELQDGGRSLLNHRKMTGIVCLTEWHKHKFIQQFPETQHKIKVIGNGVNLDKFAKVKAKIPNSFIYSSHSERGLSKILDDWSQLKNKFSGEVSPTLHIATPEYGLDYYQKHFAKKVSEHKDATFYGALSSPELYELMAKCEYWYYPTDYEETFCITALEVLGHHIKPITSGYAALSETLSDFNLSEFHKDISFKKVDKYIKQCSWENKKSIWESYIYSMKPNQPHTIVECVYVVSRDVSEEFQQHCSDQIKNKLIPGYEGSVIVKKAIEGANISNSWLEENDYTIYDNWKLENSDNDFWNRHVDPGNVGNSISQHKCWKHAYENNFNGILMLEEDFVVNEELTSKYVDEIPDDFDLFYLGRNPVKGLGRDITQDEPIGNGILVKPMASYNAHAYILSKKGVKSLLDQNFHNYIIPVDEFLPACYAGHIREDLSFIVNDLIAYAPTSDVEIVSQTSEGSITGPVVDLSNRKYPELYSYWDNQNEWVQKFIAYSTRTKEWDLIVDEPFDNCFSMPLFTEEFCVKVREEAEHSNKWTTDRHEFYPTTDMLLEEIAMDRIYYEVLKEYVIPATIHLFSLQGKGWDNMKSEDFLAKYVPNAQGHLSLHHDHSNITALVTLSNFEEYEGGGTYFSHQKKLVKEKQGYVSIHPGNITHRHGARATTKGIRYIIVSFMKNTHLMK